MSPVPDMLGDILLDEALYGGLDGEGSASPEDDIEFGPDGGALFSLQDGTQIFIEHIDDNGVESEMLQHNVVRDDGVIVVHRYDRGQMITLRGWIKAPSSTTLFPLMDTIKKNLRYVNGALYIKKPGWTYHRKHIATLISFKEVFSGHLGHMIDWCPVTFRFFSKGYSVDNHQEATTELGFTSSPTSITATNNGTADAPVECIVVFDAASSVTAVAFKNTDTGEEITLTHAIAANDVVRFDGEEKEVYLNGVAQSYTGVFPKLSVGNNTLRVTVTGSSFTANADVKWKNPYR